MSSLTAEGPALGPSGEFDALRVPYEVFTSPLEARAPVTLDEQQQMHNAYFILGALQAATHRMDARLDSDKLLESPETSTAWLGDIARSLIRGERITVEPFIPYVTDYANEEGSLCVNGQNHSLALTNLLRSIAPPAANIAITTVVHDAYSLSNNVAQTKSEQYSHTVNAAALLRSKGILKGASRPGVDYSFLPTAPYYRQSTKPGGLIAKLRESEWGDVHTSRDDFKVFTPSSALRSITSLGSMRKAPADIILLNPIEQEDHAVLHASALDSLLNGPDNRENHIAFANPLQDKVFESVYALLRATGSIKQHRFHVIHSRDYSLPPDQLTYVIGSQLGRHVQRFIDFKDQYSNFEKFGTKKYVEDNYEGENDEALQDDQDICEIVSFAMQFLGLHDVPMADIGCGPNPYPAMLFAPFASSIDLVEYAANNREYMNEFLAGNLPERHKAIWPKFGRYMVRGGGNMYLNVINKLQHIASQGRVRVEEGSIFKLPRKKWKVISQFFVDDSTTIYRGDQRDAVASVCQALDNDGLAIAGNMLNDKKHPGYRAGDALHPNLSQTPYEIKQSYTDNDMYSLVIPTSDNKKAREGYHGMALVLATQRGSKLEPKLRILRDELVQRGYKIL
jgi:hypothetical protein